MAIRNLVAAAALLISATVANAAPNVGDKPSETVFTTAYGQRLSLGDLRGEVVVLTYWVSDCEPCQVQLATLDYYYRQRRDLGLRVLAFAPEDLSDRQVRNAFKDRLIHPLSSISGPFAPKDSFPTLYVIDRYGLVQYAASGAIGIEELNRILVPLLRQPQP